MPQHRLLPPLPPATPPAAAPLADDFLRGAKAIGAFLGLTEKQVWKLAERNRRKGGMPIFNDGGGLIARRSSLIAYYERLERDATLPRDD